MSNFTIANCSEQFGCIVFGNWNKQFFSDIFPSPLGINGEIVNNVWKKIITNEKKYYIFLSGRMILNV